jgi:hypothetical protein
VGKDEKKGETRMWWKSLKGKQGNEEEEQDKEIQEKKSNSKSRHQLTRGNPFHEGGERFSLYSLSSCGFFNAIKTLNLLGLSWMSKLLKSKVILQ